MSAIFLTILVSFFVSTLFGYAVHRLLHQSWAGKLNQKHMTHHLILYPPTDYLSDKYREAGKDNTVLIFGLLALPVVAFPIILGVLNILPITLVIAALLVMGLMSFLHDYLHDSFHIKNHFLTRIPVIKVIYSYWNRLHYLHHVDMNSNYGIFLFHWDHIFKTYKIY
jgi:sterol desaturase/sphingolipid hydroxylase (fatty acid hydroxylase superfamily)